VVYPRSDFITFIPLYEVKMTKAPDVWKAVIIEGLLVSHCYKAEHETDPRKALADLISWHVAVALDPCVSSDAVKLLDAEAEACAALCAKEIKLGGDAYQCEHNIRHRIRTRIGFGTQWQYLLNM